MTHFSVSEERNDDAGTLNEEEKIFYDFLLKQGWLEKDREYLDGHPITEEYIYVNAPSMDEVPDCVRALKSLCEDYAVSREQTAAENAARAVLRGIEESSTYEAQFDNQTVKEIYNAASSAAAPFLKGK